MDPSLARTIQDADIRQVLAKYCRGIDRMDSDLVLSCFWPPNARSASVVCGAFQGAPQDWVDYVFARVEGDLVTIHQLCQSLIAIEADEAEAETYFLARHIYEEDGAAAVMAVAGRYADRLEAHAGEWRIARRDVIIDLRQFGRTDAPASVPSQGVSRRRADDPSFELGRLARR
jgi:hypothetical protein